MKLGCTSTFEACKAPSFRDPMGSMRCVLLFLRDAVLTVPSRLPTTLPAGYQVSCHLVEELGGTSLIEWIEKSPSHEERWRTVRQSQEGTSSFV